MLETTPGKPWGIGLKELLNVEKDMAWRYARLRTCSRSCGRHDQTFIYQLGRV